MLLIDCRKAWLGLIGLIGFSAVALGAVGAHAGLAADAAALAEKASWYQLLHAVALLSVSGSESKWRWITYTGWLGGIIFFCGSLYAKAFGMAAGAPLAPFGGTLLMLGWLFLPLIAKKT